jgi:TRAP transporter TAXI family solute receptor
MRYRFRAFMLLSASALLLSGAASAQTAPAGARQRVQVAETQPGGAVPQRDQFVEELNANTVTIVSGNPNGAYLYLTYDMSAVLDDGDKLRILPVIGKGGGQNTKDILYLRGVDMGITQSNILRYYNKTGEVGRNISGRLRYITRLHNEEMHLLVAPNINSIADLSGKKVNFSDVGSGSQVSSQLIFDALKIKVQEVNMGQADAFEAIKKGEIAATILIAGKPTGAYAKLKASPSEFKLIPVVYSPELQEDYLPATLTHEDYPGLIAEGQTIETIAVGAVLAVFNWPPNSERYRRVAKFTEALFKNFDKFLEKPRHPKWKEVNLAADLPGWERFGAAKELLAASTREQAAGQGRLKQDFAKFLTSSAPTETASTMSDQRREDLFRKFLEWQSTQR